MKNILLAFVFLFALSAGACASIGITGSISWEKVGDDYTYTLTINNTGTTDIGSMFFAWIPGQNYLPSTPSSATSPSGWSLVGINQAGGGQGGSIEWQANTPLTAGHSLTGFTFTTVDTPSEIFATSPYFNAPVTTTVAYEGGLFSQTSETFTFSEATTSSVTLDLAASHAVSGHNVGGTVSLGESATSATAVDLASSDPAAAGVPATLEIESGQAEGAFGVTVRQVNAPITVTITARLGTDTSDKTLLVSPVELSSVQLSSTTVYGGTGVTGTAVFDGLTPSKGTLTLKSNSLDAVVPSTAEVAAGSTSSRFGISTKTVAADTTAKISVTYEGITETATLMIVPRPGSVALLFGSGLNGRALNAGSPSALAVVAKRESLPA